MVNGPAGAGVAGGIPGGGAPAGGGGTPAGGVPTAAPGAQPGNVDPQMIIQILSAGIPQAVDERGVLDVGMLIQLWPQLAQQFGVQIPVEMMIQMVTQNPAILDALEHLGVTALQMDGQILTPQGAGPGVAGGIPSAGQIPGGGGGGAA